MGRSKLSGAWGEAVAAEYLRRKHYQIVAAGYSCKFGEIDLVVQNRKYLIFVEVKLRKNANFAEAMEFVHQKKQARVLSTAQLYIQQHGLEELQPRFDVIEVYAAEGTKTKKPKIHHLEDAFS